MLVVNPLDPSTSTLVVPSARVPSARPSIRWTRRGELPAIKLPGGAIRFREDELEEWLAERATPRRGVLAAPTDAAQRLGYPSLAVPEDEET